MNAVLASISRCKIALGLNRHSRTGISGWPWDNACGDLWLQIACGLIQFGLVRATLSGIVHVDLAALDCAVGGGSKQVLHVCKVRTCKPVATLKANDDEQVSRYGV